MAWRRRRLRPRRVAVRARCDRTLLARKHRKWSLMTMRPGTYDDFPARARQPANAERAPPTWCQSEAHTSRCTLSPSGKWKSRCVRRCARSARRASPTTVRHLVRRVALTRLNCRRRVRLTPTQHSPAPRAVSWSASRAARRSSSSTPQATRRSRRRRRPPAPASKAGRESRARQGATRTCRRRA